jgi:hypothetical protein
LHLGSNQLFPLIRDLLTIPVEGHQNQVWALSNRLKEFGLSQSQIDELLRLRWNRYHLNADPAIGRASHRVFDQDNGNAPRWPSRSQAEVDRVLAEQESMGVDRLKSESPVSEPWEMPTTEILDRLFSEGDPLLCMGESVDRFGTKPKSEFLNELAHPEANLPHLVPSTMSKLMGTTMAGKISARCRDNAGSLRFQVVDLDDEPDFDDQARILWHLKEFLPLIMILYSGNRSLHGWYLASECPAGRMGLFRSHAALLGADASLYRPEQAARTPNQMRDGENKQEVWYLDDQILIEEGGES